MYSKESGKDQMLMTMERELTSGQKAGFFFLGFLGGIVGILAASPDEHQRAVPTGGNEDGGTRICDGLRSRHPYRTCWLRRLHRAPWCQIEGGKILKDFLNQRPAFFQLRQSVRVR